MPNGYPKNESVYVVNISLFKNVKQHTAAFLGWVTVHVAKCMHTLTEGILMEKGWEKGAFLCWFAILFS
jgi:hypothetical protein